MDPEDNSNNYEILTNEYNADNGNGSTDSSNPQTVPTSPTFEVSTSLPNKKREEDRLQILIVRSWLNAKMKQNNYTQ